MEGGGRVLGEIGGGRAGTGEGDDDAGDDDGGDELEEGIVFHVVGNAVAPGLTPPPPGAVADSRAILPGKSAAAV